MSVIDLNEVDKASRELNISLEVNCKSLVDFVRELSDLCNKYEISLEARQALNDLIKNKMSTKVIDSGSKDTMRFQITL